MDVDTITTTQEYICSKCYLTIMENSPILIGCLTVLAMAINKFKTIFLKKEDYDFIFSKQTFMFPFSSFMLQIQFTLSPLLSCIKSTIVSGIPTLREFPPAVPIMLSFFIIISLYLVFSTFEIFLY